MSEINKMKEQLAAKQKEVDTAKTKLENARRIIEKQGEIYRNLVVFKESVDSFAESMNTGKYYELTRFSGMESCFQVLCESEKYVPASAMSDFKESCVFLDGIIKLRLGSKECTDIERLKLTQVQGKLEAFWSHAHETSYKEKLDESLLDSMRRNVFALDNELVILSEKLRTAENDPAQKDVAELKKLAQNACDKEDYETEFKYYRIAADKGDAEAQHLLGTMYKNGTGVKQNYQEAVRYYRLAADQGDVEAQTSLGMMYLDGEGVRQDYQEAERYYRLAADQGNLFTQVCLGYMYCNGEGVRQDYQEAARYFRLAADQGCAGVLTELGDIYRNCEGVMQNYQEAVRYYRLAANQGDADAQIRLGVMYRDGEGVRQDYQEAARYFRLAADQGDADAQFCLGMMYLHDDGVRKNPQKALKYIRLAAQQGLEKAQVILEKADADW